MVGIQEWFLIKSGMARVQYLIYKYKGTAYKARNPRFVTTLVKKWVSMYVVDQKKAHL